MVSDLTGQQMNSSKCTLMGFVHNCVFCITFSTVLNHCRLYVEGGERLGVGVEVNNLLYNNRSIVTVLIVHSPIMERGVNHMTCLLSNKVVKTEINV